MPRINSNSLKKLFLSNRGTPRRYEIENKADASEATVYLYDFIGGWDGVQASQFVKDLAALKASTVHLRINSPGGDVFDAVAMAHAIQNYPGKVIAHVDGLAASAASWIALAASEVEMAVGSMMMIHRAWGVAIGNSTDIRATADVLDKMDASIAESYVRETGNTAEQVSAWLDAETWFTAEEAVQHGFADRVAGDQAAAKNAWDLSAYASPPDSLMSNAIDQAIERAVAAAVKNLKPAAPAEPAAPIAADTTNESDHQERQRRFRLVTTGSR